MSKVVTYISKVSLLLTEATLKKQIAIPEKQFLRNHSSKGNKCSLHYNSETSQSSWCLLIYKQKLCINCVNIFYITLSLISIYNPCCIYHYSGSAETTIFPFYRQNLGNKFYLICCRCCCTTTSESYPITILIKWCSKCVGLQLLIFSGIINSSIQLGKAVLESDLV